MLAFSIITRNATININMNGDLAFNAWQIPDQIRKASIYARQSCPAIYNVSLGVTIQTFECIKLYTYIGNYSQ